MPSHGTGAVPGDRTRTIGLPAGEAAPDQLSPSHTPHSTAASSLPSSSASPARVEFTGDRRGPDHAVTLIGTGIATPADDGCPFSLAVHFPHVLVAGHPSTVCLRLHNGSVTALENLEFTLDSRALTGAARHRLRRLAPGQSADCLLEIDPGRAGHSVMQVAVVAESALSRQAWRGLHPLRVNQAPDSNIVINIGDIMSNAGGGANAGLGAEYGDVHISNLLEGAPIKSLNDLLDLELPEQFRVVALEADYELSVEAIAHDDSARRRPLRLPSAFAGSVQPGSACVLRPAAGGDTEIRLISRPVFRLGRSRTDADYITWFWPRSDAADERTRRISKVQVELGLDADGFWLRDPGSANGSLCDGLPLGGTNGVTRFSRRVQLLLAMEYNLDAEHQPAGAEGALQIAGIERWQGPADSPPIVSGCVQFTPRDTAPAPVTALWLLTEAAFGTSRSNALVLSEPALAEIQGRLHHYRGCFWLENAVGNAAVSVNGTRLAAGDIVPLVTGTHLQLGEKSYRTAIET